MAETREDGGLDPYDRTPEGAGDDLQAQAVAEPVGDELIEWEGRLRPVVRHPKLSEQTYVDTEVLATRLQRLKDPDGRREERCAAYARWRYRGYQVGEIRSL